MDASLEARKLQKYSIGEFMLNLQPLCCSKNGSRVIMSMMSVALICLFYRVVLEALSTNIGTTTKCKMLTFKV